MKSYGKNMTIADLSRISKDLCHNFYRSTKKKIKT